MIKKLIQGEILPFIFLKYTTNIISFIKIIFLVSALGNYYYGIWGFILLIRQYLTYANLGVHFSTNILLSKTDKTNIKERSEIISNAFFITIISGILIFLIAIFIKLLNINIFPQYKIIVYIIPVSIIVFLNYINLLLTNIYRVYAKLYKIAIYQMIMEFSLIPFALIFKEEQLLKYLLYTIIIIQIFSIILFLYNSPFKIKLSFSKSKIIKIIKKGISQLLYNASSVYLIISATTIVSMYFTVNQFGYYTFSNSISNAIFIGISAVSFVFFPKFINTLQENNGNKQVLLNLSNIRKIYLPIFNLIMLSIISLSGIINTFYKEYNIYHPILILLLSSRFIYGYIIGYDSVIISRNKEKKLIFFGIVTIGLNILLNLTLKKWFNISLTYTALLLVVSTIIYIYLSINYGNKLLGNKSIIKNLINAFPFEILIFIILISIQAIVDEYSIYLLFLPIIYLIIRYNEIKDSIIIAYNIFINKKSFEI